MITMGFLFARSSGYSFVALALLACVLLAPCQAAKAGLSTKFYAKTCPGVDTIVRSVVAQAVAKEPRMGASIIRLFFHDCFVNGCDASILLDDTPTFTGEKNAGANINSVRGYEVIDAIKSQVEAACKGVVSCADIVALASRDAVNLLGGPTWNVQLGRKDSRTASGTAANANLPGPASSGASLVAAFAGKGLSAREMTALSGAHTVGRARCLMFRGRIYGEANINATFAAALRQTCPQTGGGDGNLAPFDDQTPDAFDNAYFKNLVAQRGLLHSDQELFNGGSQDALVRKYAGNAGMFAGDFAKAMVKMGGLMPAAGTPTEVRLNCRKVN
ncbi:peroxidase P7-like [Oryza glaberrima]|uniref:peroxidase P7-like n=1 Tax=Oryza glaberrima TaxID=4538 RepID=UPI00224C03B0|nr:peroxidase P7-like [Oryza glaberrima]